MIIWKLIKISVNPIYFCTLPRVHCSLLVQLYSPPVFTDNIVNIVTIVDDLKSLTEGVEEAEGISLSTPRSGLHLSSKRVMQQHRNIFSKRLNEVFIGQSPYVVVVRLSLS